MKNIILLVTDTFRWDNLGDRAQRPVRTPQLDRFARERATEIHGSWMGSFPTIPHRTDLATGMLGWPHYGWQPIEVSQPNHIAAELGASGYSTQLICDCPHLFRNHFNEKFHGAFQHRNQEGDKDLLHLDDPIDVVIPDAKTRPHPRYRDRTLPSSHRWINRYSRYETQKFPARTAETAVRWLEENSTAGPFFLWVDFFDPHEPWDPPEYMVKRYDPDYRGIPMIHPNYGPADDYTPEELRNLWAHYAAEAELVDRWLGRVLQKIDDLQMWDDSIVVVHSDHGMSLGEHGRTGKSNISNERDPRFWPVYPEVSHELLLLAGGAVPRGASRSLLVQPHDLMPTVCELAGVSVSPPEPYEGRSFAAPLLQGKGRHREYAVTGCFLAPQGSAVPRRASTPFLVTEQWGYAPVGAHGRAELYRLDEDPLARQDVAADHQAEVRRLHELFLAHLAEHGAPPRFVEIWKHPGGGEGTWAVDYR